MNFLLLEISAYFSDVPIFLYLFNPMERTEVVSENFWRKQERTAAEISLIIINYSPPDFVKEYRRVSVWLWVFSEYGFFLSGGALIHFPVICLSHLCTPQALMGRPSVYISGTANGILYEAPSGYKVIFQMNLLMHMDSLRFWHDILWKVYVCINWGEPKTYWIDRKSTSIGTNVPHWNEIWLRPSGKSWRETHTGNNKKKTDNIKGKSSNQITHKNIMFTLATEKRWG